MRGRNYRRIAAILLMCLMTLSVCGTASAKTIAITGATIRVGLAIEPGDTLPDIEVINTSTDVQEGRAAYVAAKSDKYEIESAEWVTSEDRYVTVGDMPKMRIYLNPGIASSGNEYAFRGSYGSSSITVKGGTFVSARRESDGVLAVVVSVPVKGTYAAPANAQWRYNGLGRAEWNTELDRYDDYIGAVTSGYYDVCLYRGNAVVHKLENYHGTSYNFYPYMTRRGTYYFKVRTVPHTAQQKQYGKSSAWTESDEIYIDEDHVSDGSGQVDANGIETGTTQVGWIRSGSDWYFRFPTGQYQTNGWLQLNGIWYLFDGNGRMLTGWQQWKGAWYYMQPNGTMQTGWIKAGDKWYYLNTAADGVEGAMRTGWLTQGGKVYFLNSSGAMAEGWMAFNNKYYYFYPGYGYMATNTTIDTYFHVGADGAWIP